MSGKTSLHRTSLSSKYRSERIGEPDKNGKYTDVNTKEKIDYKDIDLGHKYGYEEHVSATRSA